MGDIKRKPNKYSRPRKLFDSKRIAEEKDIVKKYGLKNKKEIWKASARISDLRNRAKKLISDTEEEQSKFFIKLNKMGLKVETIADVLALKTENWLDRRLQTVVFKKGLANSPLEARQFITHKNIYVEDKVVNIPSFFVTLDLENKIKLKKEKGTKKKELKKEEIVEENSEEEKNEKRRWKNRNSLYL